MIKLLIIFILGLSIPAHAGKQTNMQLGATPDTVGLWHVNTGSGTYLENTSENPNRGIIQGGVWSSDGVFGSCLDMNGSTDYVYVSDTSHHSFTTGTADLPFSGSIWINANDANRIRPISKFDTDGNNREWMFGTAAGDGLNLYLDLSNPGTGNHEYAYNDDSDTNFKVTEGVWEMWSFSYDGRGGNGGIKLFLNGQEIENYTYGGQGTYTGMQNTSSNTNFGSYDHGTKGLLDGKMDEICLWDTEKPPAFFAYIYSRQVTMLFDYMQVKKEMYGNLLYRWRFM